jgi:hypothetical protein
MIIKIGDRMLITTDEFFTAPDGLQYKSVVGTVKAIHDAENVLGIKTNEKSTNWYIEIGNMIVAGCQVHYVIKSNIVNCNHVKDTSWGKEGVREFIRPSMIYDADICLETPKKEYVISSDFGDQKDIFIGA